MDGDKGLPWISPDEFLKSESTRLKKTQQDEGENIMPPEIARQITIVNDQLATLDKLIPRFKTRFESVLNQDLQCQQMVTPEISEIKTSTLLGAQIKDISSHLSARIAELENIIHTCEL